MRKLFKSKRGEGLVPVAVFILIAAILISAVLFIAYVQIETIVVRNAMKTGLSNLSVTISDDTYTALREGDFTEYAARLTKSSVYTNELKAAYERDVSSVIDLQTDEYRVSNIRLTFRQDGKKLEYICTCDVSFYIGLFGINQEIFARSVSVSGSHTAKYGR